MIAWKELEIRLKTGKTIDQTEMALLQAEQNRWREVSKVREALTEVRDKANDPAVRIEAQSLAEEIGSFRFQI